MKNNSGFLILSLPMLASLLICLSIIAFTAKFLQQHSSNLHKCRENLIRLQNTRMSAINRITELNPLAKALKKELAIKRAAHIAAIVSKVPPAIVATKLALEESQIRANAFSIIQKNHVYKLQLIDKSLDLKARLFKHRIGVEKLKLLGPHFPIRPKTPGPLPEYELLPHFSQSQQVGLFWKEKVELKFGNRFLRLRNWEASCSSTISAKGNQVSSVNLTRGKSFLRH